MIATIVALVFVVSVVAWGAYALIRPLTHTHYHHPSERLWRPLD